MYSCLERGAHELHFKEMLPQRIRWIINAYEEQGASIVANVCEQLFHEMGAGEKESRP